MGRLSLNRVWNSDDYRQTLWLILAIFAVVLFAGVGLRSPWPADEPRFAEVAREMVQSGQWFFPMRGGEFYPDKPPVFMWIMAFFYQLSGNIKVAFMLPNVLAGLVTVGCVFELASRLWNVRTAKYAGLVLLIAPQFILQAKSAQIDGMVTCWITLAMYGLLRHFLLKPNWYWYCAAWAFMGLGILTKGVGFLPILLVIPLTIYYFKKPSQFNGTLSVKLLLGPVVLLLVLACWLLPMLYITGHSGNPDLLAYRDNILFHQTMTRYANSWAHLKPWYYFLPQIPFLWCPFPLLLLSWHFWRQVSPKVLLLLAWCALVVVFFSCSPGKREVYILPALPMFALGIAPFLAQLRLPLWFKGVIHVVFLCVAVSAFSFAVMALAHSPIVMKLAARQNLAADELNLFASLFGSLTLIAVTGGLLLFFGVFRRQQLLERLASVAIWGWLCTSLGGYPLLEPLRTPAIPIMQKAAKLVGAQGELALVDFKEQFLLASPINLIHFSYLASDDVQESRAWQWLQQGEHRYVLVRDSNSTCFDLAKGTVLGKGYRHEWILVDSYALKQQCPLQAPMRQYQLKIQ